MDYFQGIVIDYLRANRFCFVNDEYLIQLDENEATTKGTYWFCDALTVNFKTKCVYLCEITYSKNLDSLVKRLRAWNEHWVDVCTSIKRDSNIPDGWNFEPWVFIPKSRHPIFDKKIATVFLKKPPGMPTPRVTHLENVTPWNYKTWDRRE